MLALHIDQEAVWQEAVNERCSPTLASGGGGAPPGGGAFDYNPLTARYVWTGDSIASLQDQTDFINQGIGIAGGASPRPPYAGQSVSGSEINEGTVSTNTKDLLYPTRKQLFIDAVQSGDIAAIYVGTNSSGQSGNTVQQMIDGFTALIGPLLEKGAFIEIGTILPSASNLGSRREDTNAWIKALETTGLVYNSVTYPGSRFMVVDGDAAWGGTYVSGNLHANALRSQKIGRARRDAYKDKNRAYCPRMYGVTNPADKANYALSGTGGSLTGSGTLVNNGVPTGVAIVNNVAGITVQADIVTGYTPIDSLYSSVFGFTVVKLTVTGTSSEVTDKDITITMAQNITSEAAGSPFESSAYIRFKGVGATADPTGLFAYSFGYGSVTRFSQVNSSKLTNYTKVVLGDEVVARGRMIPPVAAFGNSSIVATFRILAGDAVSFEIYFGQPYANRAERTAYAAPKSLHTDQDSIGGILATGPQVGTSNTSFAVSNGTMLTGRPGLAWFGGGLTFQFTWEKLAVDGVTISTLSGLTTVTATASTTQYTPAGLVTGEKVRLKVTATNSLGSFDAYSVWSNAHA